jgi:hypothetical protein
MKMSISNKHVKGVITYKDVVRWPRVNVFGNGDKEVRIRFPPSAKTNNTNK